MSKDEMIEDAVRTAPLSLLALKDELLIEIGNRFLPYSTGFEIECEQTDTFDEGCFTRIPDIMAVSTDSWEQRFRIPSGIRGIICLWNICEQLKLNSSLNPGSGIHYHIDMTDAFSKINTKTIGENNNWIISELETWGDFKDNRYKYCALDQRCWVQFQSGFKTMEIRVGEMSFDYSVLIKRIIHGNEIARKLRGLLGIESTKLEQTLDKDKVLEYVKYSATPNKCEYDSLIDQIKKLNEDDHEVPNSEIMNVVNKRLIKLR